MPVIAALVLVLAMTVVSGVYSLHQRVREAMEPSPPLPIRRWIGLGVTLVTIAAHVWSWLPLRPEVPPNAIAGSVVYGGPGDGGYLLLIVLLPWLCMQAVNVWLSCFCARTLKQAALIMSVLIAVWIGAAALGGAMTECPAGFVCASG